MSRTLRAAILLLFLASCGGGNFTAPRHMDDACAVIQQRPQYLAAMKVTQRRWGVPISVQMAVLYQESKFIGNARTPHQFALGVIPLGRQAAHKTVAPSNGRVARAMPVAAHRRPAIRARRCAANIDNLTATNRSVCHPGFPRFLPRAQDQRCRTRRRSLVRA